VLRVAWLSLRAISAFNRLLMRRLTIAGRILAAVLVGAAVMGIDTERSTTYQVFTLAAALLLLGLPFFLRFRPRVEAIRALPPLATAMSPCTYRLQLVNRGPVAELALIVIDDLADPRPSLAQFLQAGPPPGARSFIERHSGYARWRWLIERRSNVRIDAMSAAQIPAGGTLELAAQFTPQRRGALRFEAVTLARTDPLGLVKACRDIPLAQTLWVLPRRYRLPRLALPGSRHYQQGGVALAASVGDSEEFLSLREYRPGDPLKRIHWRSFARLGEPVVKEYQDEFFERHCLVLDTFVSVQREAQFEEAVSIAASFVCAIDTQECLLDLMFVGDRAVCFTSARGMRETQRLLELLAAAQPVGDRPFAELAAALLARQTELSSAILIFSRWDTARALLCERLTTLGVPFKAILVVLPQAQRAELPRYVIPVEAGRVELDLARAFA
jgi:uncharacterized protein (DUF58 family)